MPIDFKKVNNILRMAKSFIEMSQTEDDLTEDKISEIIKQSAEFTKVSLNSEEFEAVKRDLQYQYQVRCSPGQSILNDYEQEKWYDEIKSSIEPKFWNRYKDYLIDVKHFSPNVVNTLGDETLDEKLMNCVGNPKSENNFLKRGLIIGDVQSGKTSSYNNGLTADEFDPSGESYDDRFYRNGALITAGEYDSAIAYMENGRTLTVSDYIAPDQSHYGLDMTWEDAAGKLNGSGVVTPEPTAAPNPGGAIYGLTINKLATRTGPGTQYAEGGTYNVKGQYIQVLARAYDTRNGIWWVKCVIPYKGENRVLWTGYKRFDHSQLPLESIPIESGW